MKFRISRRADADLDEIWKFIAYDSPVAADRVEQELHAAMQRLAGSPGLGHTRADVADTRYRFWAVYSYLIAYRVSAGTLIVVRVVHGRRDIPKLLGRRRRK